MYEIAYVFTNKWRRSLVYENIYFMTNTRRPIKCIKLYICLQKQKEMHLSV